MHWQQIPFLEHGSYVQLQVSRFFSLLHSMSLTSLCRPTGNPDGRHDLNPDKGRTEYTGFFMGRQIFLDKSVQLMNHLSLDVRYSLVEIQSEGVGAVL